MKIICVCPSYNEYKLLLVSTGLTRTNTVYAKDEDNIAGQDTNCPVLFYGEITEPYVNKLDQLPRFKSFYSLLNVILDAAHPKKKV